MYDFIVKNLDIIKEQTDKTFYIDQYRFTLLGEGTYGIVFKVIFKSNIFVIKIMKKMNDEHLKLKNLKSKIDKIESPKIKKMIDKYITRIEEIIINKTNQIIIFEYLDGGDLFDFLEKNELIEEEDFFNIISKIIISITLLHNKLKISHRDLKPQNIFYNPKNKKLKLIDFGFACNLNDYSCYNRYQGTGRFFHPRMNQQKINNLNGGSLYGINTKKKNVYNNRFKSNKNNSNNLRFPKPRSQDIFAIIIIILNIYTYLDYDLNQEELILDRYLNDFFSPSLRINNRLTKIKKRLERKTLLFTNLKKINQNNITNPVISKLIELIKKYWNFKENNFILKKKDKSKTVFKNIFDICLENIKSRKNKKIFKGERKIIDL